MSAHRTVWLVCYDIRDPTRLRQVREVVLGYGERLQYSVYRCVLNGTRYERLRADLLSVIHQDDDQILLVPLGRAENKRAWRYHALGPPPLPWDDGPKIV